MKLARDVHTTQYHPLHGYLIGAADLKKGTAVTEIGPAMNQENNDGYVRFMADGSAHETPDTKDLFVK